MAASTCFIKWPLPFFFMIVPPSISLPVRKLTLTFDLMGVSFTKDIEFPNVGQLIDIATNKIYLAKNEYQTLQTAGMNDMVVVRFYIDMMATFMVLIPDLHKEWPSCQYKT